MVLDGKFRSDGDCDGDVADAVGAVSSRPTAASAAGAAGNVRRRLWIAERNGHDHRTADGAAGERHAAADDNDNDDDDDDADDDD